jgi:hypothetical protein
MADKNVQDTRELVANKVQDAMRKKGVSVEELRWRDIPRQDGSELLIRYAGKLKIFPYADFELLDLREQELDQQVDEIVDSLILDL